MENFTTTATSFTTDRYGYSSLEFEGELLFESDGCELAAFQAGELGYRIRVYRELCRDRVLEVAGDNILFETADFSQSVVEVDDVLCFVHDDAMVWLAEGRQPDATRKNTLCKSLEAQLCR